MQWTTFPNLTETPKKRFQSVFVRRFSETFFGKLEPTSFLPEYIQNIELRKRIHAGLCFDYREARA